MAELTDPAGIPKPQQGRLRYSVPAKPRKVVRKGQPKKKRPAAPRRPARPQRDPLALLDQRGINREVNAQTRLQYAPQERELANQRQSIYQQQANTPGWFQNYRNQLSQMQQSINSAYQQGQQAAYAQANQMFQGQTQAIGQQQQAAQADAAKRGATVDQSVYTQAQQGAAQNQAQGTAFGGLIGAQGANANSMAQGQIGAVGAQELQAQRDLQSKLSKADELAAQLASDKGAYRVKARGDTVDRERTFALNQQAFGLDVAKEQNDARQAAATRRLKRRSQRSLEQDRSIDNQRLSQAEQRQQTKDQRDANRDTYQRTHKLGPYKPAAGGKSAFTPREVRKGRATLRNYISLGQSRKDLPPSHDPVLASAAAQLIKYGGVDKATARKVKKAYGFTPKVRKLLPVPRHNAGGG